LFLVQSHTSQEGPHGWSLSRFLWHEATKSIASPAGWDDDYPCGTTEGGSEALQIAPQVDDEESCVSYFNEDAEDIYNTLFHHKNMSVQF